MTEEDRKEYLDSMIHKYGTQEDIELLYAEQGFDIHDFKCLSQIIQEIIMDDTIRE